MTNPDSGNRAPELAANRLEALLAENERLGEELLAAERTAELLNHANAILKEQNEHLREATKMAGKDTNVSTKWVSVNEPPKEPDYYLCRVKSFVHPGRFYVNILEYDKNGFREGHIYTDDVTHWMPLPTTEEVNP